MKIMFVTPSVSPSWGGLFTAVKELATNLGRRECHVDVVSVNAKNDTNVDGNWPNYIGYSEFSSRSNNYRYSSRLRKYLSQKIPEYDLLHIHGMWCFPQLCAARIAVRVGVPYIMTPHGMTDTNALKRKQLKKMVYWKLVERQNFLNASLIHCLTEAERGNMERMGVIGRSVVLPNGVTVPVMRQICVKEYYLYIGRLHEIKGVLELVRAWSDVGSVKLVIAGDGDINYKEMVLREIRNNENITYVGFLGKQEKEAHFQRAIATIIPSYTEGLSMVAIESLSYGTPIILTKQANMLEVEEYGAGLVIDDNSLENIRSAVKTLGGLEDAKYKNMRENAEELANKRYEWSNLILQYESIYKVVCKEYGGGAGAGQNCR